MKGMIKRISLFMLLIIGLFSFDDVFALTISADMSQDEINNVISSANNEEITVTPGDYSYTYTDSKPYHKMIIVDKDGLSLSLSGEYKELEIIVRKSTTVNSNNATIDGNINVTYNPCSALYIQSGTLTLNGALTLTNHNNAVRLGYTNANLYESSNLVLNENANLTITSSVKNTGSSYHNGTYDDMDSIYFTALGGTAGSGVSVHGKGTTSITVNRDAFLDIHGNEGPAIFVINVKKFSLNLEAGSKTSLTKNEQGLCMNTDYPEEVYVKVDNATLIVEENKSNGFTGQEKPYLLDIYNNSTVSVSKNGGIGLHNFHIMLENSILNVDNNKSHGASYVSFDSHNSTASFSNNRYMGLNITGYNEGLTSTTIDNTTLNADNNGGPGIRFFAVGKVDGVNVNTVYISDSTISAVNNSLTNNGSYGYDVPKAQGNAAYWADICTKGTLSIINSSVKANSYSLYDSDSLALASLLFIDENTVVALNKQDDKEISLDIINDLANSVSGRTYIYAGSLQAELKDTTNGDKYEFNALVLENEDYAGPVNLDGTKLIRFDLHLNVNKEVNNDGLNTFTYIDPNTGSVYDYSFRYNNKGEDLDENASGNAYVWTPSSVVTYDATEGVIDYEGSTAGVVTFDESVTLKDELTTNDRIAADITIYGNSLDLAEKVMPTAKRDGYKFLGWFVPDDDMLADGYAYEENFKELYKLLNTEFTSSDKVKYKGEEVAFLILYAKWAKESQVVVRYVDEFGKDLTDKVTLDGYEGEKYTTNEKTFEGYVLVKVEGNKEGVYGEDVTYVTYVYEFVMGQGDGEEIPDKPKTGIDSKLINLTQTMSLALLALVFKRR